MKAKSLHSNSAGTAWTVVACFLFLQGCTNPGKSKDTNRLSIAVEFPVDFRKSQLKISDKPTVTVVFKNGTPDTIVLPIGLINEDVNLFVRMSRNDPISMINSIKRGHHDSMAPFFTSSEKHVLLNPGDAYRVKVSDVSWASFIRENANETDYTGRWYLRAYFSAVYERVPESDAIRTSSEEVLWTEAEISPKYEIRFTQPWKSK